MWFKKALISNRGFTQEKDMSRLFLLFQDLAFRRYTILVLMTGIWNVKGTKWIRQQQLKNNWYIKQQSKPLKALNLVLQGFFDAINQKLVKYRNLSYFPQKLGDFLGSSWGVMCSPTTFSIFSCFFAESAYYFDLGSSGNYPTLVKSLPNYRLYTCICKWFRGVHEIGATYHNLSEGSELSYGKDG